MMDKQKIAGKDRKKKLTKKQIKKLLRNRYDLREAGATANTVCTARRRCSQWRPCRRMECPGCVERRRAYYVEAVGILARERGLRLHVTATVDWEPGEDPWIKLVGLSSVLSERLSGRIGPFVRVLAIGDLKEAPHVHYLIQIERGEEFKRLVKKYTDSRVFVDSKEAYDLDGLLGYFFSQNFIPTTTHPQRIKGLRLISGSRKSGLTYGYPRALHWKALAKSVRGEQ